MAKKSFDEEFELDSMASHGDEQASQTNKSDYDNNASESNSKLEENFSADNDEDDMEEKEDHAVRKPFISKKKSPAQSESSDISKKDQIPLRNMRDHENPKNTSGSDSEVESLLGQQVDTNIDSITVVPATPMGEQDSLGQIENGPDANVNSIQPSDVFKRCSKLLKPSKRNATLLLSILTIIVSTLFLVIFVPNSIFSIEYDKMALSRNKWTGSVDDQYTYLPGLHLMLPWKEWILFKKTAMNIQLNNMPIFTRDAMSVNTSFSMFYLFE